jgi:hypothetical protein
LKLTVRVYAKCSKVEEAEKAQHIMRLGSESAPRLG